MEPTLLTHDGAETVECADEVVVLRDGRVVAQGSSKDMLRDELSRVAALLAD